MLQKNVMVRLWSMSIVTGEALSSFSHFGVLNNILLRNKKYFDAIRFLLFVFTIFSVEENRKIEFHSKAHTLTLARYISERIGNKTKLLTYIAHIKRN